jgi:hypothetical protein
LLRNPCFNLSFSASNSCRSKMCFKSGSSIGHLVMIVSPPMRAATEGPRSDVSSARSGLSQMSQSFLSFGGRMQPDGPPRHATAPLDSPLSCLAISEWGCPHTSKMFIILIRFL